MKRKTVLLLIAILLVACSSQVPTSYPMPEPTPTLSIGYQVVESTKNTYMIVVDPQSNEDREGLRSIGERLCQASVKCKVWFWDDITKADTSYPVDPEMEQTLIAIYSSDLYAGTSELKVFTLGDER